VLLGSARSVSADGGLLVTPCLDPCTTRLHGSSPQSRSFWCEMPGQAAFEWNREEPIGRRKTPVSRRPHSDAAIQRAVEADPFRVILIAFGVATALAPLMRNVAARNASRRAAVI
jgi:hypothetical protein